MQGQGVSGKFLCGLCSENSSPWGKKKELIWDGCSLVFDVPVSNTGYMNITLHLG